MFPTGEQEGRKEGSSNKSSIDAATGDAQRERTEYLSATTLKYIACCSAVTFIIISVLVWWPLPFRYDVHDEAVNDFRVREADQPIYLPRYLREVFVVKNLPSLVAEVLLRGGERSMRSEIIREWTCINDSTFDTPKKRCPSQYVEALTIFRREHIIILAHSIPITIVSGSSHRRTCRTPTGSPSPWKPPRTPHYDVSKANWLYIGRMREGISRSSRN